VVVRTALLAVVIESVQVSHIIRGTGRSLKDDGMARTHHGDDHRHYQIRGGRPTRHCQSEKSRGSPYTAHEPRATTRQRRTAMGMEPRSTVRLQPHGGRRGPSSRPSNHPLSIDQFAHHSSWLWSAPAREQPPKGASFPIVVLAVQPGMPTTRSPVTCVVCAVTTVHITHHVHDQDHHCGTGSDG